MIKGDRVKREQTEKCKRLLNEEIVHKPKAKPCPFCGSSHVVCETRERRIKCCECGVNVDFTTCNQDMMGLWNGTYFSERILQGGNKK